jgi:predicted acetyltransferase
MAAVYRAIREEEREECLDLWCTVFATDNRDYFRRYFYGDVEWLPYYTQVAVVDGRLVSAAHICKRVVACGDFRLTMGGIANVATLPEYRGQGANTECLRHAITIMEADAMDFSSLGTGINGFYARVGFATVPQQSRYGSIRTDFAPRPTVYRVRPAIAADLPAIRALYTAYNRERPYTAQRTEAYWRDWIGLSPERIPDTLLVAVSQDDSVQGYARYDLGEKNARVSEFGRRMEAGEGQAEEVAAALLEAVAAQARAAGKPELSLHVAFEPPILAALAKILTETRVYTHKGQMMRLLNRDALIRDVAMGLNERWIAAGRPGGALAFETPYGLTRLKAEGAFLGVDTVEDAASVLPQAAYFGLLFGLLAPQEATADTTLHPLLEVLFPQRPAVYWSADGF